MKPIVLHAKGSTSLSNVLPSFRVEALVSRKDGLKNGRRVSRIDDTSQMTCRSHTEKKKDPASPFFVHFYRVIFVPSSLLPLISSALIPVLCPDISFLRLSMAACTSRSVNSGMLSLSSIAFSFSASFSSVSLFVSLLCVVRRLHLTVSAVIFVLLHIRV